MTELPTLVYLHGVGTGDVGANWREALSEALSSLGYPTLEGVNVIAPMYPHTLMGTDDREPIPAFTIKLLPRAEARLYRREFEREIGALEFLLGRYDPGTGWFGAETVVSKAQEMPSRRMKQASNYANDSAVRSSVLRRILAQLPQHGKIVLVGHSLGSVIAADLVRRLPIGVEVVGMITIGSPLGNSRFDVDGLRDALREPPSNVRWWVNFWSATDPIAAYRGVSSAFPWMLDMKAHTGLGLRAHDSASYLAESAVAEAIGYGLFGSRSREVEVLPAHASAPLDIVELWTLLGLRFGHLALAHLDRDLEARFRGALRVVQAHEIEDLRRRNEGEGRGLPAALARLAVDLADPGAEAIEPRPAGHLEKEVAVALFIVLASQNVIRPFEIQIPEKAREAALKDLASELGLGSKYGADAFSAVRTANHVASGKPAINWFAIAPAVIGAVALVVATGGLAAAVAPGVAGAAAITSALAGFGPGGMIGGLVTAGGLATAGGSGIAYGLASASTSAEVAEAVITTQLAVAILRQSQRLGQDPGVWRELVTIEMRIRREYERLDEFSDDASPTLKELKKKIQSVERALKYLRENDMAPSSTELER